MIPARDAVSHLIDFSRNAPRRLRLVRDALIAYEQRHFYRALQLLDICCQLPVTSADDLLLRSEVLTKLGAQPLAAHDVKAAFAIDPTQPAVLTRHLANLIASGAREEADKVAWAGARLGLDLKPNVACIRYLVERRNSSGFGLIHAGTESIRLVILAREEQEAAFELTVGDRRITLSCRLTRSHQLSALLGLAGIIEVPWDGGAETATLRESGQILWRETSAYRPFYKRAIPSTAPTIRLRQEDHVALTVIVPVYSGFAEAQRCVASLLTQTSKRLFRVVLVDDCGPDESLRAYVQEQQGRRGVTVLTNPFNLGFIGSVNRALQAFPEGDVLLLNADAVLPQGALDRLAAAAYADANIGTVTPLSNNGELTSYPIAFEASPIPDDETLAALDRSAQRTNQGKIIDLPNGIGFCLYIRDACRRAVGLLNDADFVEGYLEEVDYCLRAAEVGYRNVCACDIYVGHSGGTSFDDRRRELVMRNRTVLQRYFPNIVTKTYHFVTSDPLKDVRHRIQSDFLKHAKRLPGRFCLRVATKPMPKSGRGDATRLVPAETDILLLIDPLNSSKVVLHATGLPAPYALPISLDRVAPLQDLCQVLSPFTVSEVVFEDCNMPAWAAELPNALCVAHRFELGSLKGLGVNHPRDTDNRKVALIRSADCVATLSEVVANAATTLGARVELRSWQPPDVASTASIAPPADATVSVAVLPADQDDPLEWLVYLTRAGLALRQPLRFVVVGPTKDPERLRRTGFISVIERPALDLAKDVFQLHRCGSTIAAFGANLQDNEFLELAWLAPRPCFVDRNDARDVLARGGEAVVMGALTDSLRLHRQLYADNGQVAIAVDG